MIASMEDVLGVSTKVLLVGSSTIASMEDVLWLSNEHRKCSGQVSTEVNRSTCSKTVCGRRNCDLVDVICEVASCCVVSKLTNLSENKYIKCTAKLYFDFCFRTWH